MKFEHTKSMLNPDQADGMTKYDFIAGWRVRTNNFDVYRISTVDMLYAFLPYVLLSTLRLVFSDPGKRRYCSNSIVLYPAFVLLAPGAEAFVIRDIIKKLEALPHKGSDYVGRERVRRNVREVAITYSSLKHTKPLEAVHGRGEYVVVDEAALQRRMEGD